MTAKDMRGFGDQWWPAHTRMRLLGKCAFAPVEPAVGTKVRPVQIVAAVRQSLAVKPDLALVRNTVIVRVRQFPDLRWRRDIQGSS